MTVEVTTVRRSIVNDIWTLSDFVNKHEQHRVAVGPENAHVISIRQVSSDAATLLCGRCGHCCMARRCRHCCWLEFFESNFTAIRLLKINYYLLIRTT